MQLSGKTAAERLLGYRRWQTGMCLQAVWNAFGTPKSDGKSPYMLARQGWETTPLSRRSYDRAPPLGAVVYFINTRNPSAPGHIAIALGQGDAIASTDKPGTGQIGRSSIADIEKSWGGRTYVGWTDYFLGHDIITGDPATAKPVPASPLTILGAQKMIRIQSPGRGLALIGPGYFLALSSTAEVKASEALITKHISGSDADFDTWKWLATGGRPAAA